MFRDKNILVTGGTGSIGSELVRKILQYNPEVIRIFSNDEDGLFNLEQELQGHPNLRFLIGDVGNKERLKMAVENIDFVFHAAALKHVPLCEYNPFEAVKTNVIGTQNLIEVVTEAEKMITISTDKATNPVNVMGATKLLAERLTISANKYSKKTVFSCVRFGNVLDSRGSVVPLFKKQIEKGGPITVTEPNMTRFVMSISRAVDLVLQATGMARGGEIFIFKMPALRINDLTEVIIEEIAPKYGYDPKDIKLNVIGKRAGEKYHEELMTEEEAMDAFETDEMFILLPQTIERKQVTAKQAAVKRYLSQEQRLLSKSEIKELLSANGLL
jgi:UDP-N-acetylglucosamine 4,6-dehydratase